MNRYLELKKNFRQEIDEFPLFWAFNKMQFEEGMTELGLKPNQLDEVCRLPAGAICRKNDAPRFIEMLLNHDKSMKAAIDADETGEGFIFDMFNYELANYEYAYTRDATETLEALNLTFADVRASSRLNHGLKKAIAAQKYDF